MGIWASIKNKLRRIVPVPRTYLDKKLGDMEKENKRQSKVIGDQVPGTGRTGKGTLGRLRICSDSEALSGQTWRVYSGRHQGGLGLRGRRRCGTGASRLSFLQT